MAAPDPAELLKSGDLSAAIDAVKGQVRKQPAKAEHRILLFQLMSIMGDWDRALTQLNVLADLDAATLPMVQTYREGLRCEALRAEVFAGKRTPLLFGKPQSWMAGIVQALQMHGEGQVKAASDLRNQNLEQAETTAGTINGEAFDWIADADSRIGPFLEAVISGRYYWIPFSRLRKITVEEPADVRDFVWAPVQLTFANGGQSVALVPSRYTGSEKSEDPKIQLARLTEWDASAEAPDVYTGRGQRLFATDKADYALLDTREILLDSEEDTESEMPGGAKLDISAGAVGKVPGSGEGEG